MPRAPYYSGSIAGGAQAYAAPAKPSLLQSVLAPAAGMLLGQGIGGMVAGRFRDPNTDPNAMLARQRAAEAALKEEELARSQRGARALQGFGETAATYTRELPERIGASPSPEAQEGVRRMMSGALQGAIAAGADPEQASALLNAFYLQFADAEGDQMRTMVNAAGMGRDPTYLNKGQASSNMRQDILREGDFAQETSIQDSKNDTDRYGFDTQAAASRYGADASAGATLGSARIRADVDAANNVRDNVTTARENTRGLVFNAMVGNAPKVETRTTSATGADGRSRGSKTETTTRGIAGGGRGRAASAPAANDPFPGIAEGEIVVQGGQRYRRQGDQMVPVT